MLPDDVFRTRLQATITAMRYWAPSIVDAARVEEAESADVWRMSVRPQVASACPFALVLHTEQRYDLHIGGEHYDGRPIESFSWFVPFASAVADGSVVQRRWRSRLTGLERAVETVVTLPDGGMWRDVRGDPPHMPSLGDDGLELHERRFLPYRR